MSSMTAEYVRSRIDYDPETGILTWKPKAVRTPIDKMWNTRFAGTVINHHNSTGHIQCGLDGHNYLGHRIAWLIVHGEWPADDLDHEDKVRDNNRLRNLRPATRSQNCCNTKMRSNNISGFRGIWRNGKRWGARIGLENSKVYLGSFATKEMAARAYDEAAVELHGDFASLNFQT